MAVPVKSGSETPHVLGLYLEKMRIKREPSISAKDVISLYYLLEADNVQVYIGGGWGIDALVGEQTRPHRDLDLSFNADHEHRMIECLERAGFSIEEDQRPVRFVMQDALGRGIDLHPVVFDKSGAGIQTGFDGVLRYPADGFARGQIDGQTVWCFSAALQVHFHSGYSPGERDVADMRLLRDRLGVQLPPNTNRLRVHMPVILPTILDLACKRVKWSNVTN